MSIESLDVATGDLLTTSYLAVSWTDEFLKWDPDKYDSITKLSLPYDMVWIPPLSQQNGALQETSGQLIREGYANVIVNPSGTVHLLTTGHFSTKCDIDTRLYPFDSHHCFFIYISARHDSEEMTLTSSLSGLSLGFFQTNYAWMILTTKSKNVHFVEENVGYDINGLEFSLTVTRRHEFELINTYVPIFLLTTLNVATSLVPADSGERLSFVITLYLSFIFITTSLVDEMPRNAIRITTTSYIMVSLNVLNTTGVLWSVFIVRLSKWSTTRHKIPQSLIALVRWLKYKEKTFRQTSVHTTMTVSELKENIDNVDTKEVDIGADLKWDEAESRHGDTCVTWLQVADVFDKAYFVVTCVFVIIVMSVLISFWVF